MAEQARQKDQTLKRVLRFACGVSLSFIVTQLVAWPLAYVMPVLTALLLLDPDPLPVRSAVRVLLMSVLAIFFGYQIATVLTPYPVVFVGVFGLLLFRLYLYLLVSGAHFIGITGALLGCLLMPVLVQVHPAVAASVAVGIVGDLVVAVLMSWVAFMLLPVSGVPKVSAAKTVSHDMAVHLSARLTLVAMPLFVAFLIFEWTNALTLIFGVLFATGMNSRGGAAKGFESLFGTVLHGGLTMLLCYELLVMAPFLPLMVLVLFTACMLYGARIMKGGPHRQIWWSGMSAFLLLLGSSFAAEDATTSGKLIDRSGMILLAAMYVVFAYNTLDLIQHGLNRFKIRARLTKAAEWKMKSPFLTRVLLVAALLVLAVSNQAFAATPTGDLNFPPSFDSYGDAELESIGSILWNRISMAPFNLIATFIFFAAIIHTFLAGKFLDLSHKRAKAHEEKIKRGEAKETSSDILAGVYHFLGEIEVVFGLWTIPLLLAIVSFYDWSTAVAYIDQGVNLTEAAFVIVIMVLASTRPILKLAERFMLAISRLLGGTLGAFWVTAMTIGPLLGSFITEPAAMTITAGLLAQRFYDLDPSASFKYATLGLLFVNISIGGTLTHFAAPPILMVAGPWEWDTSFMITTFGWKAIVGILLGNAAYFLLFRKELATLQDKFALQALKEDISRRFVPRDLMEQEYKAAAKEVDAVQNTGAAIEAQIRDFFSGVRTRVEADVLPSMSSQGVEQNLVKEALDKRFDEVVLFRVRKSVPGALPEDQRAPFEDPDWDKREDAVPAWITTVHVVFMGWTI
ncbi:MAG: putative Na+/H+ antiporter, partial [Rhizobiaceae bacterium]